MSKPNGGSLWTPEGEVPLDDRIKVYVILTVGITEQNQIAVVWDDKNKERIIDNLTAIQKQTVKRAILQAVEQSLNKHIILLY